MKFHTSWMILGCVALCGCGSSTDKPAETADDEPMVHSGPKSSGIQVMQDVGALNEDDVMETFQASAGDISDCFSEGASRLPYLSGRIGFKIRVGEGGSASQVFVTDSTLGDHQTEQCMVGVLRRADWPAPEGGREGIAENSFEFDPGGARQPVAWSEADLGEELDEARPELSACRSSAGSSAVKITMYIDTDGTPRSVGAAAGDGDAERAIQCVVDKLSGLTFPSPGSYASKVSVTIH